MPPLTGRVTDLTGTLTAEQKSSLDQALIAFEQRKGSHQPRGDMPRGK